MNLAYVDSGDGSLIMAIVSVLSTLLFIAAIVGVTVFVTRRVTARRQPPAG